MGSFILSSLKNIVTALVASFTMLSIAVANTPVAEIPYRYDYGGWITVPVLVNGQGPYDFIIDSGATLTVTFENLEAQQNFPPVAGNQRRILGLLEVSNLPPKFIGDLIIGGQPLPNLTSVVVPDWPTPRRTPHGVLGLDFLSQYVVEVDPTDNLVRLYKNGPPDIVKRRGWIRTRMNETNFAPYTKPLYTVNVKIGSERYPFILDLGASGSIINIEMTRQLIKGVGIHLNEKGRQTRIPKVQDLFGNEETSRLIRIPRMSLGKYRWRNQVITVFDAKVFEELGVQERPYGLLGADLLRDTPLVLDFQNNRLYLQKPKK